MNANELIQALETLSQHVRETKESFCFSPTILAPDFRALFQRKETASEQLCAISLHLKTLLAYCGQGLIALLQEQFPEKLLRDQNLLINPTETQLEMLGLKIPIILLNKPQDTSFVFHGIPNCAVQIYATEQAHMTLLDGNFTLHGRALAQAFGKTQVYAYDFSQLRCNDQSEAIFNDYSRGYLSADNAICVHDHACVTKENTGDQAGYRVAYSGENVLVAKEQGAFAGPCYFYENEEIPLHPNECNLTPLQSNLENEALIDRYVEFDPSRLTMPQHYKPEYGEAAFERLKAEFRETTREALDSYTLQEYTQKPTNRLEFLDQLVESDEFEAILKYTNMAELLRRHYTPVELKAKQLTLFDQGNTIDFVKGRHYVGAHNRVDQKAGTQVYYIEKSQGIVKHAAGYFVHQAIGFLHGAAGTADQQSLLFVKDSSVEGYGNAVITAYGASRCWVNDKATCLCHDLSRAQNNDDATTIQYGTANVVAQSGTVYGDKPYIQASEQAKAFTSAALLEQVRHAGTSLDHANNVTHSIQR